MAVPAGAWAADRQTGSAESRAKLFEADEASERAARPALHAAGAVDLVERSEIERGESCGDGRVAAGHGTERIGLA